MLARYLRDPTILQSACYHTISLKTTTVVAGVHFAMSQRRQHWHRCLFGDVKAVRYMSPIASTLLSSTCTAQGAVTFCGSAVLRHTVRQGLRLNSGVWLEPRGFSVHSWLSLDGDVRRLPVYEASI